MKADKNCHVCSDDMCEKVECIRKKYIIKNCGNCPAELVCHEGLDRMHCNKVRNDIEKLINESRGYHNV